MGIQYNLYIYLTKYMFILLVLNLYVETMIYSMTLGC